MRLLLARNDRNARCVIHFVIGVLLTAGAAAESSAQLPSPNIEGQYACGDQWYRMMLRLSGRGTDIEGEADLQSRRYSMNNRRVLPGTPTKLKGRLDTDARVFSFTTNSDVQLVVNGPTRKTEFRGTIDEQGIISGTLDYPGCGKFFAAAQGSPASATMLRTVRQQQHAEQTDRANVSAELAERQREADRSARRATGWVPVELRPGGGRITASEGMLEYADSELAGNVVPAGVRPIDEVHQFLFERNHKCLATTRVSWNGNTASAATELFSQKSYVIDCDGNCKGMRYEPHVGVLAAGHAGLTAAPIVTLVSRLGRTTVPWRFTRPDDGTPPPEVRIHMWTSVFGDYGGGCRLR